MNYWLTLSFKWFKYIDIDDSFKEMIISIQKQDYPPGCETWFTAGCIYKLGGSVSKRLFFEGAESF